jgi:hypothetical protein
VNRREFGKNGAIAAGVMAGSFAGTKASHAAEKPLESPISLVLDESIKVSILAPDVKISGESRCPVSLSKIRFAFDHATNRLTAKVTAGKLMFDNVNYVVSGAVFDADGGLLGAARVVCEIRREILRVVLAVTQELVLDFGRSRRYSDAKSFQLCLSDPDDRR